MNNQYKKIGQLIHDLKETGKVKFKDAEYRYYIDSVTDDLIEKLRGIKFDSSILSFYKQIDFIKLNWTLMENSGLNFIDEEIDIIGGSLNIPTFIFLVEMIQNESSQLIIDPDKTLKGFAYQSLKNYIPFDIFDGEGAVCFKILKGEIFNELYFVSTGLDKFIKPLNVSCQQYLDEGIKLYYFFRWQQACFFDDEMIKEEINFYLTQLKNQ